MNNNGDTVSFMEKAENVLERATALVPRVGSWAEFSNSLFDQATGLVPNTFTDQMELQAFWDTEQYAQINRMLVRLIDKYGSADGSNSKSGRVLVRLPKSIHQTLEIEARAEKTSLNQLILSKVSFPLRNTVDLAYKLIVGAFSDVHDGYSSERVVVDPLINQRFLMRCREIALNGSDFDLNHRLYDVRKTCPGLLPPTTKKTEFRDYDEYRFAAEIGVRTLQRTQGVTLDRILCDPELAREFDGIVERFVEVPSRLKLRWAALNLRKTHKLVRDDANAPHYDLNVIGKISTIAPDDLPEGVAAYALYDQNWPIYAGETENIRKRVGRHLKYGVGVCEASGLSLRIQTGDDTLKHQENRLRWLRWFINKERPLLNYQKVA